MSINLTTNLSFGTLLTDSEEKQRNGLSRTGHTVVAVFLGIILFLGFINNFIVLVLFCKFKVLRNPVNMLLLNISISDMLVCLSGTTLSFASSIRGRWIGGYHGCRWYGFANSCFGIVSLISLAILSYERYRTLTLCPRRGADYQKAILAVASSWLYSLVWTVPPLIGWSSYGTEGAGTSCSVHWTSKSVESVSYIMCLFIFCLVIPILIMIYFYGRLLYTVKQVGKIRKTAARKREYHVLFMVVTAVICYLICWVPYGMIALLATFGPPGMVSPVANIIPSILAKSSTVCNPIIYILMNKQFYKCFLILFHCQPASSAPDASLYPSKVTVIQLGQRKNKEVSCTIQDLPEVSEKQLCLLSPESSVVPASEHPPEKMKETPLSE
ncbi:vertebrate ancient opsin-like [Dromiciops gliroides]|uniref:vertebrate ancient opsin-like n=1 Tax=Dromiciops gliroides TaxID=33562 RepID=UPI001CC41E2C|nr:vertebrate ancient opsin-like [Dromiciops gliroides]